MVVVADGEAPSAAMLIELSRKTGLPRGVLPEKEKKEKGASFYTGHEAAVRCAM